MSDPTPETRPELPTPRAPLIRWRHGIAPGLVVVLWVLLASPKRLPWLQGTPLQLTVFFFGAVALATLPDRRNAVVRPAAAHDNK